MREERIGGKKEKERNEKREEEKRSERLQLLSRIFGNRTIEFCRSKRESSSTQRELRVGTRIRSFRQTLRGRNFSLTRFILGLSHSNGMRCLGLRTAVQFSSKILGLNVGILRTISDSLGLDFGTVFRQSGTEFVDCFRVVQS